MKRAAVAAIAVALLAGCAAQAAPGAKIRTPGKAHGHTFTLSVPLGKVNVTVGSPVSRLSKTRTNDLKARKAPDGGALVPVSWGIDYFTDPFVSLGATRHRATLALLAGGHRYQLQSFGPSYSWFAPVYVAVPTTKDLTLALTYDGLTQTVDVASGKRHEGAAAGIDDARQSSRKCATDWAPPAPLHTTIDCSVSATTLPWAGRWAEPGHEFVVVALDATAQRFTAGGVAYSITGVADHTTLDGVAPEQPLGSDATAPEWVHGRLVFDVPKGAHRLGLDLTYHLDADGSSRGQPQHRDVDLTETLPLFS